MNKFLIIIPTYNEVNNVAILINELTKLVDQIKDLLLSILFIDDSSPDGTGVLLDKISKNSKIEINILHRQSKLGIGSAHKDGILWAYNNGWNDVITMDSDGSHRIEDVYKLINLEKKNSLVVCSRWLSNDSLVNWSYKRRLITKLGHFLTKNILKLPYDATNAFRYYRLTDIPIKLFSEIKSTKYSFFYESIFLFNKNNIDIGEFSISLPSRTYGNSKMSYIDIVYGVFYLFYIYLNNLFYIISNKKNNKILKLDNNIISKSTVIENEWDHYWSGKKVNGKGIYDYIAAFYRLIIIKPALNFFIYKYFKYECKILHAGCGSGMVDIDVSERFSIVGFDISKKALELYKKNHSFNSVVVQGSIFNIPQNLGKFHGIFNLGVMEHFSEDEIKNILISFNNSLNDKGYLILFWPPSYGLATIFLRYFKKIMNFFNFNIKLHPDEITYADNKDVIQSYLENSGFQLIEFYFGFKDLFTHRIIVAEKINSLIMK